MDGLEVETVEVTADAKGDVSIPVPESAPQTPAPAVPAELSFRSGDLMADLAKLAAEQGTVAPAAVPQTPPVIPEIPRTVEPEQSATTPATQVQEKFKNPDGTVNEEKVAKSTQSAQERIAALDKLLAYEKAEKEMRQKENAVAALKNPPPAQPQAQQVPVNVPLTPLELSMAQDLLNEAAALGYQMPQAQAIAQAKVMARGLEAKHAAEASLTEDIRTRLDLQDRRSELEKIADKDEWVLSPDGIAALTEVRKSRPHVNASPTPWTTAYREILADREMQRLTGQVPNPTPKGPAAKAPPTPVGPAPRVVVKSAEPNFNAMTVDQINAYAASLGPKGEAKFWADRGFKP